MAFLRQCLQELRLRQREPNPCGLDYPTRIRGRDTYTFCVVPPLTGRAEALTKQANPPCSEPFSNPRSTAPA